MSELTNKPNKKKLLVLVGILIAAVIILIVAAAINSKKQGTGNTNQVENQPGTQTEVSTTTPDAAAVVKEIEVAPITATQPLKDVKIVVPGANPITADNKVVTPEGKATNNSAAPMSAAAPKQTGFLVKEDLPTTMTQLTITAKGISPSQFTTKPGAPTSISVTSGDDSVHVFTFTDSSLAAIAILVGPGQTKAIVFNAPTTAGEYEFHCASPDHAPRGETGKMIVK